MQGANHDPSVGGSVPYYHQLKRRSDILIPLDRVLAAEKADRNAKISKFATAALICLLAIAIIVILGLVLARFV